MLEPCILQGRREEKGENEKGLSFPSPLSTVQKIWSCAGERRTVREEMVEGDIPLRARLRLTLRTLYTLDPYRKLTAPSLNRHVSLRPVEARASLNR